MPVELHSSLPKAAPVDSSEAWKAAEAEFLQPPHDPASSGGSVVVVKRKRPHVPGSDGVAAGPGLAEEARAPRVFRVDPASTHAPMAEVPSEGGDEVPGHEARSEGVTPITPRRRVKKHGEVTITRPGPPDFGALKHRALADLDSIRAEIQKLERRAEALRKVEAARAVRWIRKEIARYGLTASDLGL